MPSTSRGDLATTPNGEGDDGYQLSIAEGDRIDLSGEAKDGWHYGENLRTGKLGTPPFEEEAARPLSVDYRYKLRFGKIRLRGARRLFFMLYILIAR